MKTRRISSDLERQELKLKVMALIPAYNEEETIKDIVTKARGYVGEVIVIDDGSTDSTPEFAEHAGATVVSHVINRGVGAAVRTGYRYGTERGFDYIVQIDGDGQHDPRYIPKLLEAAEDGSDIVIGSRFLNESYKGYSLLRRTGIIFFTRLGNLLSGLEITDITSGFRVYRVESLKKLSRNQDKHWAVEQTLEAARKGLKINEVSVEMPTRELGKSQFNPHTFFWYPIRMIEIILRILIFRRLV